jgi:hypothetical protein
LRRVLQGSEGDIRVTCPRLVMTHVNLQRPYVLYFHHLFFRSIVLWRPDPA